MTIEERPNIVSPNVEKFNMDIYKNARRDRLDDMISDYLNDEETTPTEFYNDLVGKLQEWIDYYEKFAEKYKLALKIVNGHRSISSVNFNDDTITNYSPEYLAENDFWGSQYTSPDTISLS